VYANTNENRPQVLRRCETPTPEISSANWDGDMSVNRDGEEESQVHLCDSSLRSLSAAEAGRSTAHCLSRMCDATRDAVLR